jgi:2,3-bisphosphoglycerate-independent phosphoglycerate mutase
MGHQGSVERKIQAIENLDQRVIKIVKEGMEKNNEEFRMMILPDHPTPIAVRTHTSDPIPYLLYDSTAPVESGRLYNEADAKESGNFVMEGYTLIDHLLQL